MKYSRIDGTVFKNMMKNALNNLKKREEYVNAINVFPAPDGDTGSNMRMTLENGILNAKEDKHAGNYIKNLAENMFKGARGNSGVILALMFIGIAETFTRKSILDASELYEGFQAGVKNAYKHTRNPKEGTILTVAREGISALYGKVSRNLDVDVFFSVYLAEMRKSLAKTPEILPILKEAGVVDSGAFGYIIIIEGALKFLQNEIIDGNDLNVVSDDVRPTVSGRGEYGYCAEFVLELTNGIDIEEFNSSLDEMGESIVSARLGDTVKVHIHTRKPGEVLTFAQKFGEFSSVKIENMDIQAENAGISLTNKNSELAKVVFCDGIKSKELFEELGCSVLETLNPSTEEIANAIKKTNSKNVAVIANNKNAVLAADQAVKLTNDVNVTVLETTNILEGYYVAASDDVTSKNNEYRMKSMQEALSLINTFIVFSAVRGCTINEVEIGVGDFVTASSEEILEADKDFVRVILKTMENADLSSYSAMIIMKGRSFPADDDELMTTLLKFTELDVNILEGNFSQNAAIIGFI